MNEPVRAYPPALRALWAAVMVSLPVTSFRYYPHVFGTTQVKPLAFLPLVFAVPWALFLTWRARQWRWLAVVVPLLFFGLWALVSTLTGFFRQPAPWVGLSYPARALRAWLSFGVGLSFLLAALLFNRNLEELRFSLRWLYVGFVVVAVWGSLQVVALKVYYPLWPRLGHWQASFSAIGLLPHRISGMAYEPSWFANQLVGLYLPWLVASLAGGVSLFRWRAASAVLALVAAVLLVFTYSRGGVLTALAALLIVGLLALRRWLRGFRQSAAWRRAWPRLTAAGLLVGLVLAGSVALLLQNAYFASLFHLEPGQSVVRHFIEAHSGPRLAYAWAGLGVFAQHPWLGVGLGGSGFFLPQHLPSWSVTWLPEVARLTSRQYLAFLNPKDMYVRLLAETGIVGFVAFVAFVAMLVGYARRWCIGSADGRWVGLAAVWILVATALRWFTQDSLAMPTLWISVGLFLGPLAWALPAQSAP